MAALLHLKQPTDAASPWQKHPFSLTPSTAGQVCELGQITAFSPVPARESALNKCGYYT